MTVADRPVEIPRLENPGALRVAVIFAEWNSQVTFALRDSAVATLLRAGVPEEGIVCIPVPGTVELTYAAARCVDYYDAVIIIGCVIRGDTPHFDYVCSSVTQGMTQLNLLGKAPVIFCVLTVENRAQALDRCGGSAGDKGAEAAVAALSMAVLKTR